MRFNAIALAEGWWNSTLAALPMLKLCQSSPRREVAWSIVICAPLVRIAPVPTMILPPLGKAFGAGGRICAAASEATSDETRRLNNRLGPRSQWERRRTLRRTSVRADMALTPHHPHGR